MRVVTWNCRRASATSPVWEYLDALDPDVAVLQEVSGLPRRIFDRYEWHLTKPLGRTGKLQAFSSCVLVRGHVVRPLELTSGIDWMDAELVRYGGNLPALELEIQGDRWIYLVGVYSPAWPLDSAKRYGIDVGPVKLSLNRRLWLADLLVCALRAMMPTAGGDWIVAGDFNLSETFDTLWKGGPRGNREFLDRIEALGLTDCLRHAHGTLTPTFRSPRGGSVLHQIDHLFVTRKLLVELGGCRIGDAETVFAGGLSDHLPIVADLGD